MVVDSRRFKRWAVSCSDEILINKISNSGLHCGFPSPAADYEQERINLIKELVPNPEYSEYVITEGDCCIDRGIMDPGLIIVDYTEFPRHNDLVYVRLNDADSVRVYCLESNSVVLRTANSHKNYPPVYLSQDDTVEIRGVVIKIIIDPREVSRRNVRTGGHK